MNTGTRKTFWGVVNMTSKKGRHEFYLTFLIYIYFFEFLYPFIGNEIETETFNEIIKKINKLHPLDFCFYFKTQEDKVNVQDAFMNIRTLSVSV